ncbi:MAG: hypothetical protein GWP05_06930 [Anaerolineaceae bacterium]|nr:hypothetical protein [Anaerolineaceae bacterium]
MSKPLIAATVFAACALVFLVTMAVRHSGAKDAYNEADILWQNSKGAQQKLVDRMAQLSKDKGKVPKSFDVPSMMLNLSKQLKIDAPEVNKQGATRGQQRHSVVFPNQSLDTIGKILLQIRKQFKFLTVRNIEATRSAGSDAATFKWTLTIASPLQQ